MARNHGMDFCAPASGDRFTACPIDPGMEMVMPHTRASPLKSSPKGNLKGEATGVHKLLLCALTPQQSRGSLWSPTVSLSQCSCPLPSLSFPLTTELGIKPRD